MGGLRPIHMRVLRTFPVAWSLITSSSPAVTQFTQLPFTTAPLPSHTQTQTEIEHTKPSATPHQNSPIAHALTTATLISRTYTPQTAPVTNTVPPKTSSTATFGNFNERETKMMAVVMAQCTKAPVEIDFQKLADAFGLKNAASARTAWHGVKKKIEAMNQQDDGGKSGHDDLCAPSWICAIFLLMVAAYRRRGWRDRR